MEFWSAQEATFIWARHWGYAGEQIAEEDGVLERSGGYLHLGQALGIRWRTDRRGGWSSGALRRLPSSGPGIGDTLANRSQRRMEFWSAQEATFIWARHWGYAGE